MSSETREVLLQLEQELMQPEIRRDPARVATLLDAEFVEIGASGRLWSRVEILALLAQEPEYEQPQIEDFRLRMLGPEVAQVTYRTTSARRGATLRSSLWRRRDNRWQCLFHQGTPAAATQAGSSTG